MGRQDSESETFIKLLLCRQCLWGFKYGKSWILWLL